MCITRSGSVYIERAMDSREEESVYTLNPEEGACPNVGPHLNYQAFKTHVRKCINGRLLNIQCENCQQWLKNAFEKVFHEDL